MSNIVICTSECCPYENNCYRKQKQIVEDQEYYNFGYTCNEISGFESYIINNKGSI